MLTVRDLLPFYKTRRAIAQAFVPPITAAAVSRWPNGVLPEKRELEMRYDILPDKLHPDLDKNSSKSKVNNSV